MDYDAGLSLCVCLYNETDVNLPSFLFFFWQIPTLFVRVRMGASWSVMLVTSFKGQGRERWPPDFGIDRKKMRVKLFLYPWEYKNNVCLSGKCLNAFNEFIQDKIRAGGGDWRTHAVSRFDRYLPWGGWMCVSRRVDFTGEEKKRAETRTSLNLKEKSRPCATRATPRLQHHANPHIIPASSRPRHEKEKKNKNRQTDMHMILHSLFFWGAIRRVKGDKRWECRRTFPSLSLLGFSMQMHLSRTVGASA
jgi:hypothetical protein